LPSREDSKQKGKTQKKKAIPAREDPTAEQ
jgi:hypothetical protein